MLNAIYGGVTTSFSNNTEPISKFYLRGLGDADRHTLYRVDYRSVGMRGCAENPVRDLAALVVLEERRMPEALSDAGSAGRKGRAYVMLVYFFYI
jgi:hypothetical protein